MSWHRKTIFSDIGKVYVGNLPENVKKDELDRVFRRFGQIREVIIAGRRYPCFAFVKFENIRDAEDAIKALDGTQICGVRARVEMSHDRGRGGDRGGSRNNYFRDFGSRRDGKRFLDRSLSRSPERNGRSVSSLMARRFDVGGGENFNVDRDFGGSTLKEDCPYHCIKCPAGGHPEEDKDHLFKWEVSSGESEEETNPKLIKHPKLIKKRDRSIHEKQECSSSLQKENKSSTKQFSNLLSQLIECLVCYDKVELSQIVFCNITTSPTKNINPQFHPFCQTCIIGQASAAIGEIPLAKGGIGLRCMMPDCENPILLSEIRPFLSDNIQKKLDDRILQECIGMALINNLERCKKCNFAIEMDIDKSINKVFHCLNCNQKMCRLCERDWDDEHFGISCKELEEKEKDKKDKKEREFEKQLNELIVRKCPRCKLQFLKENGCNLMTCRCGITQCYICRESEIEYTHFCQHFRDPTKPPGCTECNKSCLLHEDSNKKDEQLIKEIHENEAKKGLFKQIKT